MKLDLLLFRMNKLGMPQERISGRLNLPQKTISDHLARMLMLANPLNTDLKKGFTVAQVAEKHGWPESLVWSLKLDGKSDAAKYRELQWGLRTWGNWYWTDCLPREIHVNDSRADFTGATNASVMNGPEEYLLNS
jgi:hypothetical protein